ncbi:MAG: hypothetical protein U0790_07430 [Isosphaeraceae bacterium]
MRRKPRRSASPRVESLEPRALLSVTATPQGPFAPQAGTEVQAGAAAEKSKVELKRLTTFIAGTLIPARLWKDGKGKGTLLVAGETAWFLDLSETKGLSGWGKRLSHRQVVAIGSGKLTRDALGKIKRTFEVTWIEPLRLERSPRLLADRAEVTPLGDLPQEPK